MMRSLRHLFLARQLCLKEKWLPSTEPHRTQMCRAVHSPATQGPPQTNSRSTLMPYEDVFAKEQKNKASFVQVLNLFCKKDIRRRGHVEMIEAALRWMPEFGVEKDLEVYNTLLDIFPKEVFVPQNFIQRMFHHYPRQQECAINVLEHMENYGITPNKQTHFLLLQIFGDRSHPIKKYQRLMYWFPRFKHVNPYKVPENLSDPVELSRVCLQRIAADRDACVTVYEKPSVREREDSSEQNTHIVGIQSPEQVSLLAEHDPSMPVLVDGPHPLWLKTTCVYYYVLRADPTSLRKEVEVDPERSLYYPLRLDLDLDRDLGDDDSFDIDDGLYQNKILWRHLSGSPLDTGNSSAAYTVNQAIDHLNTNPDFSKLEEGPVFAMCTTSSGDERSLGKWIQGLQATNPILGRVPVLFRISPRPQELISHPVNVNEKPQEEVEEEEESEPVRHRMEQ